MKIFLILYLVVNGQMSTNKLIVPDMESCSKLATQFQQAGTYTHVECKVSKSLKKEQK